MRSSKTQTYLVFHFRMRPEFSRLLLDIYPELEDNLAMVAQNQPLPFMEKSIFFWSHTYPEDGMRSQSR